LNELYYLHTYLLSTQSNQITKHMKRRDFVQYAGMGAGAMMMPSLLMGNNIPAEALLEPGMDTVLKKKMADVALNTAKSMGATYADARIEDT
jgi:TldD protein